MYSDELSIELRQKIAEKLGLLSKKGWPTIKALLSQYGAQEELIMAAGISHQAEAKSWLINFLDTDNFNLIGLKALGCWGASLPLTLIKKTLKHPKQTIRLAGLELLHFKAHQLSDDELLAITQETRCDFRDPVVLATIKILQRRDSLDICNALSKIARLGSGSSGEAAILALGSIGNSNSIKILFDLK